MAQQPSNSVMEAAGHAMPTSPQSPRLDAVPYATPPKLKSRKRLLLGLERMGSSPSLTKLGRAHSAGYRSGGKGSMSCVSLSSYGSPYGSSLGTTYSPDFSAGFPTAPTSTVTTPAVDASFLDQTARVRVLGLATQSSVPLPSELRPSSRTGLASSLTGIEVDYFSRPMTTSKKPKRRENFSFWDDMPAEIRMEILRYLKPREAIRCASVSRSWHRMCFDGQLWGNLDTADFYRDIPADALINIITSAGPFVRDLNLRGCVQLREKWNSKGLADACRNLQNLSIEGCRIDRTTIHCFLLQNSRLVHINLSGLAGATNSAMKIIAQYCPKIEHLNISWCNNVDTRGIRKVVEGCPHLSDLRAGEVRGWNDVDFMLELFKRNKLERLIITNCDSLSDESLTALMEGVDNEIDYLTGRPVVPPRKLKHLDLTRCRGVTDTGIKSLVRNVPSLEGLQLSKCHGLTDASLTELLPTVPNLTHLDLEELDEITNASLQALANAPCKQHLSHLSISYCENLGDAGMLPVLKSCPRLATLDMDNTRISDLVLAEAAAAIRARNRAARGITASERPAIGLRLVAYDCANVTWTGVREVLSRNAEITRPQQRANAAASATGAAPVAPAVPTYPREIIQLKCFYNWQPTVEEHTKRVLRGDFAAAARLERKWAEWMMLNEEAGAVGAGGRRRRRRAREAQMMHADEEEGGLGAGNGVVGRRRRARSGPGGCVVM